MERINFNQERDLGTTLQDSSTFIKQNFLKIMKPTLTVVMIPLLIGAFLMITGIQSMYSDMATMADPLQIYGAMAGMIPAYILMLIAFVLAYIMFIGYIKLYAEGQDDITLSDLTPFLKSKGLSLTLSSIVLIITMYLGMILCVLPGVYLAIVFAHFFAISIIEDTGFGATWKRSFFLIKDNWWSTFGLYLVTYLIALGVMILVYIPAYAIMAMGMFSAVNENDPSAMMNSVSTGMSYIIPFYYLIGLVMSLLYAVVSSFRYFSLMEQKDGSSERELINQI
ncbi:MAG: hypothetical protein ABJO02_03890 [Reichenbachiella sp.]|uniref:hypothetical protein n=1 Tax=Reichenbachiella sp. TaxID=2184521 RepID=UPI0032969C8B